MPAPAPASAFTSSSCVVGKKNIRGWEKLAPGSEALSQPEQVQLSPHYSGGEDQGYGSFT